ncbi:MAG: tyrosine--tRNA ligase [Acidimicrobiales bacterium]
MTPPPQPSLQLSSELTWRGLVHQTTDDRLLPRLDQAPHTAYIGFDPTADSLHLGNLLMLCTLRRMQEAGHTVIALAGGGTGMIGDPGGRSDERALLSRQDLEHNLARIKGQLGRIVDLSPGRGLLVNNGDWLWETGLLEFLRDVGKHFTVNQMVAKDSVRSRFEGRESGISYTEFSYMLLQASDFLQLFRRFGCTVQGGGSDQWGNIVTGIDLIRRVEGATAYGLTSPLVTMADGTKYGKSVAGAIWLDPAQTSPYAMWQFLLNADDVKVGQYLRSFTWRPRDEITELDRATAEQPGRRLAQRALADDVTALVHGPEEAARAGRIAAVLFTPDVASLDEASLGDAVAGLSTGRLPAEGLSMTEAVVAAGLAASGGAARRLVEQGGISVNGSKVDPADAERLLGPGDALHGRFLLLRKGKRDQAVLRTDAPDV